MSEQMDNAIAGLRKVMQEEGINPEEGLTTPLFLFATSLVPMPNIDLLVLNEQGQMLLSWRDDLVYGKGWHIPGGCLRIRETLEERVRKTAETELGVLVRYEQEPIVIREGILKRKRPWLENQLVRSHHISFMYAATEDGERLKTVIRQESGCKSGCLKWFDSVPQNLLEEQTELYGDVLELWFRNREHFLRDGFNIHYIAEKMRQILHTRDFERNKS